MFQYNMFDELETPLIILSTKYHKHLGKINTIDINTIQQKLQMASHQEVSFVVYKELDGQKCELWDKIVDFKYIYIPKFDIYYEITVSIDENDKTIKHVVGTSACEAELSTRKLTLECNTESDILRDDYIPTVLYNPENPKASLLHRVFNDKCPDYSIAHVDSSIANIQRTFSVSNADVYSFFTNTVAEEIQCLFVFDSVNRSVSVYDLMYYCDECGYRGESSDACPECGSSNYRTYGENTGVYISAENYAENITFEGDTDNVFNCLKIEGGDDLMTATVANINPNGSNYVYNFSELMKEDMPDELVEKIESYNNLYNELSEDYAEYTQKLYESISEELYLTDEMMPDVVIPETTAEEELDKLLANLTEVAVQNITTLSLTSADLAVKGMAKVLIDARYKVEVAESSLSDLKNSNTQRSWTGKFVVTNNSNEEDIATSTSTSSITIVGNNYEEYLYQRIQKKLGNKDSTFTTIFEIEDINEFKTELTKYSLNRLKSFESSYQTCLEVLIENGVTNANTQFYDVDLYNTMYVPYHERILAIQSELVVREASIKEVQDEKSQYEKLRNDIQSQLDFRKYLNEDLWIIFSHYLKEDVYTNSNYISDGLTNSELIQRAKELYEVGLKEVVKASTLQISLSSTVNNLLNTKEFAPFKNKFALGNWINTKCDDVVYKQRLITIEIDYSNLDKIDVLFSNVSKVQNIISDAESILSQAQSMSKTYNTVIHQASQGKNANATINECRNVGLNSALYNIVNSETQDVKVDEHGISCRKFDDVTDDFSPEQLRVINNTIAFTKNNWKSVQAALGKLKYKLNNVMYEDYGLNADHVIAGLIIAGDIYSANYLADEDGNLTQGTHFDLESGDFALGDGRIVYDSEEQKMTIKDVDLDWTTTNKPNVEVDDINGLQEEIETVMSVEAGKIRTEVSSTYSTKTETATAKSEAISTASADATTKANNALASAKTDATTKANNALSAANTNTANQLKNYSTTVQMNSAIEQSAENITSTVSKTYATQESVKATTDNLQQQIDGAIETFTGSTVPTLSNSPAKDWTTTAIKDTHIGDLYIVNSSGGNYAGFYYRFEKRGSTYQWVLLKDNEVTKALQDAKEANDKAQAVANNLAKNYSTTTQMNSAITQSAENITSAVSKTYSTKTETTNAMNSAVSTASADATTKANNALASAKTDATTKANNALSAANTNTANQLKNYSTTAQMNSAIEQSASSIKSTVSATYTTKEEFNNLEIGGRNLVVGSATWNFKQYHISPYVGTLTIVDDTDAKSGKHIEIKCTTAGNGFFSHPYKCKSGTTYTYSFWAKASVAKTGSKFGFDNGGKMNISLTTEWQYYKYTFTANNIQYTGFINYLDWNANEIFYIRDFKLEEGNKATTWTPAPEDVDSSISEAIQVTETKFDSTISQLPDSILETVSERHYLKTETDELVNELSTSFEQTSTSFKMQFNVLNQNLNILSNNTDSQFTEISKYIRFEDGNIILGESNNELILKIENDRIAFIQNNNVVAYFTDKKLYVTDGEYTNSLKLGKFAFIPESSGSLSFKKVEE